MKKYFRENQKGSHNLVSFLDNKSSRKARRHNYRSECGIFGPEFVNVVCAVDEAGNHYAICVCLGPMTEKELEDLESHIGEVSYICADNYEVYSVWTKEHNWKHYVEPSSYRKERSARGYVNTDNIYSQLSKEDYAKDRKINEQLYKEGRYPHIENTKRPIPYDEFIALKYKFGLEINRVNSYHNILEKDLVKNKTGVGSNYLQDYVLAYNYLTNYKSRHNVSTFSHKGAESILVEMVELTLANKYSPTRTDIENLNIDDLPRPSAKMTNEAQRRMVKAREIINIEKVDDKDKSAYETDDTNAQFMFNKRKFFQAIGTIRLNELIKQYGLYQPHQTKRQKIDKMCALENVQTSFSMKCIFIITVQSKNLKQQSMHFRRKEKEEDQRRLYNKTNKKFILVISCHKNCIIIMDKGFT